MYRLNMYNCFECAHTGGLVQDSYIHDLVANNSASDVSGTGGSSLQVVHDTLLNQHSSEYVVFCPSTNCLVNDNLLAGGAFVIEGGGGSSANSSSNIVITGNRFSTLYFPSYGSQGDAVHFDNTDSENVWSGNVTDGTNQALPL
jgi:hypothetical protein